MPHILQRLQSRPYRVRPYAKTSAKSATNISNIISTDDIRLEYMLLTITIMIAEVENALATRMGEILLPSMESFPLIGYTANFGKEVRQGELLLEECSRMLEYLSLRTILHDSIRSLRCRLTATFRITLDSLGLLTLSSHHALTKLEPHEDRYKKPGELRWNNQSAMASAFKLANEIWGFSNSDQEWIGVISQLLAENQRFKLRWSEDQSNLKNLNYQVQHLSNALEISEARNHATDAATDAATDENRCLKIKVRSLQCKIAAAEDWVTYTEDQFTAMELHYKGQLKKLQDSKITISAKVNLYKNAWETVEQQKIYLRNENLELTNLLRDVLNHSQLPCFEEHEYVGETDLFDQNSPLANKESLQSELRRAVRGPNDLAMDGLPSSFGEPSAINESESNWLVTSSLPPSSATNPPGITDSLDGDAMYFSKMADFYSSSTLPIASTFPGLLTFRSASTVELIAISPCSSFNTKPLGHIPNQSITDNDPYMKPKMRLPLT
ncbi:hypothetical protein BC936DRAFT_142063 [Jimgerdemannia flammicorona]|uniref:Uncharacterized protein n=1 Tax=Jimgerdemannia flammicorona TaxID=994334 RepID=A0A433A127_9FUNG|nr:hypothetical protein BC936DRAFT_142063 [Jimgerdemannia flammicorona]